jgi:hypothetical protein
VLTNRGRAQIATKSAFKHKKISKKLKKFSYLEGFADLMGNLQFRQKF